MNKLVRIGTRESRLAVWQAELVRSQLEDAGYSTELVFIKSDGDINLITPLYELGIQGIFTKILDTALLDDKIDIAVHSYKDVPTLPAKGLVVSAVLKRATHFDMLVLKEGVKIPVDPGPLSLVIATSSIRRKAQWLHRHPGSSIENLRGNVNTRIQKLENSEWDGAIFAAAGLQRLGLMPEETGPQHLLEWMIPAPAQGAIAVMCRDNDETIISACMSLNDEDTRICTQVERDFLRHLQGGCSTPLSAYAYIRENRIYFKGNVTAADGSMSVTVSADGELKDQDIAKKAAAEILQKGAGKLIST